MYTRLSEELILSRQESYFNDRLFCTVSSILDRFSSENDDLSAVEVWSEALDVVSKLSQSQRPELLVSSLRNQLLRRYSVFKDDDKEIIKRTKEAAWETADKVLTCILYMLCAGDELEQYHPLALKIGTLIAGSPMLLEFYKEQRIAEAIEESGGHPIDVINYFSVHNPEEDHTKGSISSLISIPADLFSSFADINKMSEFCDIIRFRIHPFIASPEGNAQLWEVVRLISIEKGYITTRCARNRFARIMVLICPTVGSAEKLKSNMEKYSKIGLELDNDKCSIRSRFNL